MLKSHLRISFPFLLHYPSSTTMLTMCVVPTAVMQLNGRIANPMLRGWTKGSLLAFLVMMIVLRLWSGVHWFTDIIGGALFSVGVILVYRALSERFGTPT